MSFLIEQRMYPSRFPRPSIEVENHDKDGFLIITSPWGTRDASRQVNQTMSEHYGSNLADPEATSPFGKLPGLSPAANSLRVACLMANNLIFEKFNKTLYTTGCEALLMARHQSEITWVQIGQPHLILVRGDALHLLQAGLDMTMDFPNKIPLAGKLLGVERPVELETKSLVVQKQDKFILLNRSTIPQSYFASPFNALDSSQLHRQLFDLAVADDPDQTFWLGVVTLG